MRLSVALGALLLIGSVGTAALGREWSDKSGKFKVEAKLVVVKDGKVYLEKADGSTIAVPLERLSDADLDHLQSQPECEQYFAEHPLPAPEGGPQMVRLASDIEGAGEIRRFPDMKWGVRSLAFSPNGGRLAAGKMDQALMFFDLVKTECTAFFERLEGLGEVTCLAFTPDGKNLLSGGGRGRIQIWEVKPNGSLVEGQRFVGHSEEVNSITISADGAMVLSGGREKKVRLWELATCREQCAIDGFEGAVKATFLSRSGKQALACDGATLALIDTKLGKVRQAMKLASYTAQSIAIAPDGSKVVVSDTYALRVWDIRTGREQPPLQDQEIQWSAAFLPNSRYLISGGRGKVNLWDVPKRQKLHEYDMAGTYYVQTLAASPDRTHFAAIPGSAGQDLQVFRLPADVAGAAEKAEE